MPTEAELARRKYPRKCEAKRCYGYGLYWIRPGASVQPFAMSKTGAEMGFRTIPCPECGADCNPNGGC